MQSMTEGLLATGNEVRVLAIETDKHPFRPEKISAELKSRTGIEAVYVDTRVKIFSALLHLFKSSSYNIDRFDSPGFEAKLNEVLEKETFDVIILESPYMGPYLETLRRKSKAKIVLRAHNVESALWKRRTESEDNLLKSLWFANLTKKILRYEKELIRKVDAIVPITTDDASAFVQLLDGLKKPIHVFPYCVRLPEGTKENPQPNTVFHLGSMDWMPNIEGVNWLVKKVWPEVLAKIPHAELHLGGKQLRKGDPRFSGRNVTIHGEVENASEFLSRYAVMAVPLHSGGGMRIKMVEGMALEKAIVTTTLGAEGTGVQHERHVLIADDSETFARAICRLLEDPNVGARLGKNAGAYAKAEFELVAASKKLTEFYASLSR